MNNLIYTIIVVFASLETIVAKRKFFVGLPTSVDSSYSSNQNYFSEICTYNPNEKVYVCDNVKSADNFPTELTAYNYKPLAPLVNNENLVHQRVPPAFGTTKPNYRNQKPYHGNKKPPYYRKPKPYYEKKRPNPPQYEYDQSNYEYDQPNYEYDEPNDQSNYEYNQPNYDYDQPNYEYDQPNYEYDEPNYEYNQPNYKYGQPNYEYDQYEYDEPNYGYDQPNYAYSQPAYDYAAPQYEYNQNANYMLPTPPLMIASKQDYLKKPDTIGDLIKNVAISIFDA